MSGNFIHILSNSLFIVQSKAMKPRTFILQLDNSLSVLSWWCSGKESARQSKRCRFDPWVGKRKWQPTLVFLPNPMNREAWQVTVYGITKELDVTQQLENNNLIKYFLMLVVFQIHPIDFQGYQEQNICQEYVTSHQNIFFFPISKFNIFLFYSQDFENPIK